MTTYREPPKDSWNGPPVSMWTRSSGAAARDVVLCGVGARMPLAIEHPEHGTSSPTSWIPCCWAVAFNTLEWAWARETWKWLISNNFLFCFCLGTFHQERILLQPSHHITRNRLRLFSLLSCCNGTFPLIPHPRCSSCMNCSHLMFNAQRGKLHYGTVQGKRVLQTLPVRYSRSRFLPALL